MKPKRNWYYIEAPEQDKLNRVSTNTTLNEASIASIIIASALKALEKNGFKLTLPLELEIRDDAQFTATRFNEPTEKRK